MLNKIRKACSINDKILFKIKQKLEKKEFLTEKDIENFIRSEAKKTRCTLAFKSVISTGKNTSEIHHKPTDKRIGKGFLMLDFGVNYKGYCSDVTRMFYIGKPAKKEKEIYDLVLLAQKTALSCAKPGEYAADVDLIARNILLKYFSHFRHGLGHGVGKKIHEGPHLRPRGRRILKENDVITIEPGLYFKNFGVRIEDTIVVRNKPEILTKFTKELIII